MPVTKVAVRGEPVAFDRATVPVAEADLLLTVGESALGSVVSDPPRIPVLPVDAGVGRHGVESAAVDSVLAAAPADVDDWTVPHPVLSVTVDGEQTARGIFDVTLLTSEAARISEYAIEDRVGALAEVRADGVVVSTPLGSAGYAHASGGPVLTAGAGLAVVPISPYTTRPRTWVVDDTGVSLTVQRDDCPVSLFVDGTAHGTVPVGSSVSVDATDSVELLRPP